MNTFPWMIFFLLTAAGMLGTLAVIPYSLTMNKDATEKIKSGIQANGKRMPSVPVMILLSAVQSTVLLGAASFVGLLASRQVGLGLPILQAALAGQPVGGMVKEMLAPALLLGLGSGVVIIALEAGYFMPRIPRKLASMDTNIAFWKRVLACFYGGIDEEILLRLFVMGGLVWLLGLVWQTPTGAPALGAYWTANILAAVLFGLGHLPATKAIVKLSPMVVARAVVLNGIPGLVCGYLFMRYGLEAAMLCHFSLDILLHLIMPPILHLRVQTLPKEQTASSQSA